MEHNIPLYALLPFVLMLGCIAVLPLLMEHWWEENKNKLIISAILGIPTTMWLIANHMGHELSHTIIAEYIPFIILLGSLFITTGGIYVDGDIQSKPFINTAILAIGAVLASFIGTTGAAMLLIRPLISSNSERQYKVHTILFFIGIVANCGGMLTPLGDPPLFLMYLKGANFAWFLNLWGPWLLTNAILLTVYFLVDSHYWKKETPEAKIWDHDNIRPIKIEGKINFLFLLGIILSVAFINDKTFEFIKTNEIFQHLRDLVMIILAILSIVFTQKIVREKNQFSWGPIVEVAYLFIGIFVTMVPALEYLRLNAPSLGLTQGWQFYYAAGSLSSFLDNAPTALTFYNVALGMQTGATSVATNMVAGIPELFMMAISAGSVLFGSMTYIGNGPNFMVKAIAESQGIKMPSFFGYMIKFSLIVLLPTFVLVHLIFF